MILEDVASNNELFRAKSSSLGTQLKESWHSRITLRPTCRAIPPTAWNRATPMVEEATRNAMNTDDLRMRTAHHPVVRMVSRSLQMSSSGYANSQ